jgi:hypothetical protein
MRRPSSDLIVVLVLFAAFLAINVFLARDAGRSGLGLGLASEPSVYDADSSGAKAVYRILRELGVSVRAWERSWTSPPADGLFVVLAPGMPWQPAPEEKRALARWVKSGGRLLVICPDDDALARLLDYHLTPSAEKGFARPAALSPATVAVDEVVVSGPARFAPGGTRVPLVADRAGPALVSYPLGRGLVIAGSDLSLVNNAGLREEDNALLAVNGIVAAAAGGTVHFDEYHHGHRERAGLLAALGRPPALWVVLQVLLVGLLLVHRAGRRFGAPRPLLPAPRHRAAIEYVSAMAGLYQRARATGLAAAALGEAFRRDLSRALGLSAGSMAGASDESLAVAAERARRGSGREVREALAEARALAAINHPGPRRLLRLARRLEHLRRELCPDDLSSSRHR